MNEERTEKQRYPCLFTVNQSMHLRCCQLKPYENNELLYSVFNIYVKEWRSVLLIETTCYHMKAIRPATRSPHTFTLSLYRPSYRLVPCGNPNTPSINQS